MFTGQDVVKSPLPVEVLCQREGIADQYNGLIGLDCINTISAHIEVLLEDGRNLLE